MNEIGTNVCVVTRICAGRAVWLLRPEPGG